MITTLANQRTNEARSAIMNSIHEHLAESERREVSRNQLKPEEGAAFDVLSHERKAGPDHASRVTMFRERLEAVGGHCLVVRDERGAAAALKKIIDSAALSSPHPDPLPQGEGKSPTQRRRLAVSNAPVVARLVQDLNAEDREIAITPNANDLFNFDVGITSAQIAVAETGTLVLESDSERHRLISLVPSVHIAIVEARNIVQTLGDALRHVQSEGTRAMSRAITFITGPSRTADIELTLAIGVHGPKELYVIVVESNMS